MTAFIGTAGLNIARAQAGRFPAEGSSLERYASTFHAVEINSSFHRSHRASTWARWANSVPADFRFSVKLPKSITHERKLADCDELLAQFTEEVGALGPKLRVLLIQLPPKLEYDRGRATRFFSQLASLTSARLVCEARHPSWFGGSAEAFFKSARIAQVAADPAPVPLAARPGGVLDLKYWRLHGAPRIYYSAYDERRLVEYAELIRKELGAGTDVWCMFDNTASAAALSNAWRLTELLAEKR